MTELTNPCLQIIETKLVDNSITKFEYVEYLPRDSNNMNKNDQHIIETKDEDFFFLPHKAYLEIKGKLQTNANANYNNNDVISLVNNGWSLFQTAQYQLNNQTIENINLYLPQASTILNLVSFSDNYSRSTASNMLWFKDTGTGFPSLNPLSTKKIPNKLYHWDPMTPDIIKVSSCNDLLQINILTLNHDINEQFKHKNK